MNFSSTMDTMDRSARSTIDCDLRKLGMMWLNNKSLVLKVFGKA